MTNLWEFLLQTLTVSLVAAILLLVKTIFMDKLSPRWQYGVWSLLALRVLLPAGMARNIVLPLPLWLETLKARAESGLSSSFSAAFVPLDMEHILPWFKGLPQSLTDWLFVVYAGGVLLWLLRYGLNYLRLRRLLGGARPLSPAMEEKLEHVCEKYGLRPCRALALEGIRSAFVCGFVRPVLVLPAGADTDEKVLLHELLHLRHGDVWQNALWGILRALHWCNPFLHFVFDRIGNDMESLCDQRVLERLEGEERREYGGILLSMANEKYARAPGTSSISNGGKNIARRIKAIVRFKKYPQGMALVSVCILLALSSPLLVGVRADSYETEDYEPRGESEFQLAMARTRVHRCGTLAGALDTYAKGLIDENGLYIATASPLSRQEELYEAMRQVKGNAGSTWEYFEDWYLSAGLELVYAQGGYSVYNLRPEGEAYLAELAIHIRYVRDENRNGMALLDENREQYEDCYAVIPVRVWQEDGAWVVQESGQRVISTDKYDDAYFGMSDDIPLYYVMEAEGETGSVRVEYYRIHTVNNTIQSDSLFGSSASFDHTLKLDAEFEQVTGRSLVTYLCHDTENGPRGHIAIRSKILGELNEEVDFSRIPAYKINGAGSSSDGYSWVGQDVDEAWDGSVVDYNATGWIDPDDMEGGVPAGYRVQILWDGEIVEEVTVWEVVE